jgi:hypothetical protein
VLAVDTAATHLTYQKEPDPSGPGSFQFTNSFIGSLCCAEKLVQWNMKPSNADTVKFPCIRAMVAHTGRCSNYRAPVF